LPKPRDPDGAAPHSCRLGQQFPPVYLNHVAVSLDKATLDDLAASPFLKDELMLRQQTTQVDGGTRSNTALYVSGRQTYVEIGLGVVGQPPAPGTDPLGDLGFGMWIDDRAQLPRFVTGWPNECIANRKLLFCGCFAMVTT
jgi:hypothetical protein